MYDPLGDGISKVELLNVMGDDLTVANAARVSMAKHHEELNASDAKLISYLAKHNHWTPFSHPQIQLRIKMPIFVARQWYKHMVGFTRNEVSRRYVDDEPEFFIPDAWRLRAENVKQGSSDEIHADSGTISRYASQAAYEALLVYDRMLDNGICPEQARMILPQNMYTEFYETGSLAAYARLCGLRLDAHSQLETRKYAEAVSKIVGELFPVSWEALNEAS